MSSAELGAAIIGGGFMARVHADALRAAGVRLVAVASSSPARSAAAALELRAGYAATLAEICADPEIASVHICTPNTSHAEIARMVLRSGKHVVCEKPLSTTVKEAEELLDMATTRGLVNAVPFVYRFHPVVRQMRDRVLAGDPGTVVTVVGSYYQDWLASESDSDWRVDAALGGPSRAFADIGSHLVDLLEFVSGHQIDHLVAEVDTVVERRGDQRVETEDQAAILGRTDRGAVVSLVVSQVAPGHKNALALEIIGRTESLAFEQQNPDRFWIGRQRHSELVQRDPALLDPRSLRYSPVPAGHPLGYRDAFELFVRDVYATIVGEARDGLPTFQDGLRAARVTEAVLHSAREGGWVTIAR